MRGIVVYSLDMEHNETTERNTMTAAHEEIKNAYRDYPDHILRSAINLAARSTAGGHIREERQAVAKACEELLRERAEQV
jgi:hypothetical protein